MTSFARPGLWLLAALFVGAGILHIVYPNPFIQIVPPQLPKPEWLVAISGLAEILGGVGILVRFARPSARWGLVALLVCVFPANIYMAREDLSPAGLQIPQSLLWVRLLFQPLLVWWVLAATKVDSRR